jgi:pyruvate-formate lyase-activating enzyme
MAIQTAMLEFPTTVLLDTTNLCNARCPFCPLFVGNHQVDRTVRPATVMDQALYERILTELAGWNREVVIVSSSNGEILQDPKFIERMAAVHRIGIGRFIHLLTNGQFLNADASAAILDAGVARIILGFDGASKEVYEAHRVRCDYERVLTNIRGFVEMRRGHKAKTSIEIKFVRTTRNEHEVAQAYKMFAEIMDAELDQFHDCLAHDWSDGDMASTGLYYLDKYPKGARLKTCWYFDTGLQIQPDGKIGACCWDYNLTISGGDLGDVKDGVLAAWRSTQHAEFARKLENPATTPPKCETCIIIHKMPVLDTSWDRIDAKTLVYRGPNSLLYRFPTPAA